ncbi:DUF4396 domain-containing protein [Nonomuraea sp. NPDC001699]
MSESMRHGRHDSGHHAPHPHDQDAAPGAHAHHGQDSAHGDHAHHAHHQEPAHGDHTQHDGGGHGHTMQATWGVAASATLHCLTGCAIGEVLGMVIATALGWHNLPSVVLAIVLAFFFGYALTLRGLFRAGVDWRNALRLALAADTLSILVMEIVDNGVMLIIPGAMDAGLASVLFWAALAISLVVAFLVTTPINKWIIGRGKGHAVVHAYHH